MRGNVILILWPGGCVVLEEVILKWNKSTRSLTEISSSAIENPTLVR